MNTSDVVFVGGGVMGCAIAYHLLRLDPTLKVTIVEKDPTYAKSSTVLSDGNIRVQFNVRENILISLYGLEALKTFSEDMAVGDWKPDVSFHKEGNLFLSDEESREASLAGMQLAQSLGGVVEWLEASEVKARYPFLDTTTIAGGTFGPNDGTMDPYTVLKAYKDKSIDLGASYVVGEVVRVDTADGQVQGVTLADGTTIRARYIVNSAGAWGIEVARNLGIMLPIEPVMRHVFHFEASVSSDKKLPLIVFPSGLYLHHESANHYLAGKSLPVDHKGFDFTFRRHLFNDYFWEELAHYMPAFEQLKLIDGWVGLYDVNTMDGNALLGEWPELRGFILVLGFSGHGFQQCHAVGAYLADVILGRTPRLDLSVFSPERILNGTPIHENAHKLV